MGRKIWPLSRLAPVVLLAACSVPSEPSKPDHDLCGASRLQGLVGQPKAVLARMELPKGTRVIGPSQAVTMDFRPTRLNVETGPDQRIARIGCY
ncbi:MAG: I78 family peptidase inhibitor [Paracoccus sp. (in: a-proteobacteria)]|uniref:I78 family peptidase inhibitor n=1 Tax=Paracoccus sp. TaxID=267 RepID=UPI0039E21BF8